MKRFFAVIMACLMTMAMFSGCGKADENGANNPTEREMGENTIAYAGDYEITRDEINSYIYLLTPYIQQYYTGSSEGWENIILSEGLTARDVLINMAIEQYRDHMAFVEYVKDKGLYSDEAADDDFDAFIAEVGGEDIFNAELANYNLGAEGFKLYTAYSGAYTALMEASCTDEAADKIYNEEYITAKHILVLTEGRESEDEAYNEALKLYNRAISGESFEELIKNYGEDPGQDPSTGYTFTIGTMVDEFYEGAMMLNEGEISEPIKTSYGYHVIKKYPNPEKDSDSYKNTIEEIKNAKASNLITDEVYETIIAPYPLEINESILSSIDLSLYTAPEVLDENVNYVDGSVFNE